MDIRMSTRGIFNISMSNIVKQMQENLITQ